MGRSQDCKERIENQPDATGYDRQNNMQNVIWTAFLARHWLVAFPAKTRLNLSHLLTLKFSKTKYCCRNLCEDASSIPANRCFVDKRYRSQAMPSPSRSNL
jgi:hypothetical protein